jgi:hypothetical protein
MELGKRGIVGSIVFCDTLNDALNVGINKHDTFDQIICVETMLSFKPDFVLDYVEDKPFIMGTYPIPVLDWSLVQQKIAKGKTNEPIEQTGLQYNIDPKDIVESITSNNKRWLKVTNGRVGLLKIHTSALKEMAEKARVGTTDKYLFLREWCNDTDIIGKEEYLLRHVWGKDIHVDCELGTADSQGSFPYYGCVGDRLSTFIQPSVST